MTIKLLYWNEAKNKYTAYSVILKFKNDTATFAVISKFKNENAANSVIKS